MVNDDLSDNLTGSTLPDDVTMPAGAGGGGYGEDAVLDLIAAEGLDKKKRSGALVIVGVVVLAAASLFSMHTLTKAHGKDESDPKATKTVDDWLLNDQKQQEADMERVIDGLTHDYTKNQIATAELKADPFEGDEEVGGAAVEPKGDGCEDEIRAAAKELKLNSVLLGATPTAIINGKLARLNREVTITVRNRKVAFLVTAITADSATVVAGCEGSEAKVETTIFIKRW